MTQGEAASSEAIMMGQVACACIMEDWTECNPVYRPTRDCNQQEVDISKGRDPDQNPYSDEEWYIRSVEGDPICDLDCPKIFQLDEKVCLCRPLTWKECDPIYEPDEDCN